MERMKTVTTPELLVRAGPDSMPRMTITTDAVDAMQDRILQGGLTFRTPLPVLFAHDYQDLPVGQSTRDMIARLPHRTEAQWRWLEGDERATQVRNAFEQGFLGASVGMRVYDATPNDVGGYDITRAEVVEFSLTAVPANPECVRLLKDLGWGPGRGQCEETVLHLADDGDEVVLHLVDEPETIYVFDTTADRTEDAELRRLLADVIRAEVGPTVETAVTTSLRVLGRLRGSRR